MSLCNIWFDFFPGYIGYMCLLISLSMGSNFNPWVEASAGGLLIPEGLYSPVAKYFGTCCEIRIRIELLRKKRTFCRFIWKRRIISQSHSSILRRIWLNFMTLCLVFIRQLFQFSQGFFSDFQLFRPEQHWSDLSSRNAHLVHQNC
jgi:hypothetical protein